ncbi:unnamed protein product [Lampetra planeri]
MAAIFELPSSACQKFLLRRQWEAETPLVFCSALLALGWAAYSNMDCAVLDSLALERLLSLARELSVVLAIAEESDNSSLKVAQGIQAHLHQWPSVAECAGVLGPAEAGTHRTKIISPPSLHAISAGEAAVAGEDFSLTGVGIHHLLPLWPAWPYHKGLLQRSWGLWQDLVSLHLHIGVIIWASGNSRCISHSAAPSTSHI